MKATEVIKSVSDDQHEILYNIMNLHNNGKPFDCDITYSLGKFYGKFKLIKDNIVLEYEIPQPKYKFDVCPQTEDTVKIEPLGRIPLEDESIDSIVVDLPFVVTVGPSLKEDKKGQNVIAKRFSGYYPVDKLYESYYWWLGECYRVLKPNGTCVWKNQSTVSGGIEHNTNCWSFIVAMHFGFIAEDDFVLTSKARLISGKIKKQYHSRKYHSNFWVFKKFTSKKYKKYDYFKLMDRFNQQFKNYPYFDDTKEEKFYGDEA